MLHGLDPLEEAREANDEATELLVAVEAPGDEEDWGPETRTEVLAAELVCAFVELSATPVVEEDLNALHNEVNITELPSVNEAVIGIGKLLDMTSEGFLEMKSMLDFAVELLRATLPGVEAVINGGLEAIFDERVV